MRRFTNAVLAYVCLCLFVAAVIVLRGDGPRPRIVAIFPPNGDRYWPGGGAQITFSQPMDEGSVERALQVTPGSQGQGAWYGNTLNLQPVGDWRPNVTYHVKLVGNVTDDQGRPLPTPASFWFRVHHVGRLAYCPIHGIRNVCERMSRGRRPLTQSPTPVRHFALSSDGSTLAYTRRDASRLPHLFIIGVDGTGARQLTSGTAYEDEGVWWAYGDNNSVNYYRRPVTGSGSGPRYGKRQIWNIKVDGADNLRLS